MSKIVLDIETQKSFDEVGGRGNFHLLKVSVVGIYSYLKGEYMTFEESEISKLEEMLKSATLIIGFNIKRFDFIVLEPYLTIPINTLPALDIMEEIVKLVGHRVSLESAAQATLGKGKLGNGLDALRFFKEGKIEELKKYCLHDVMITKEIYEYGQTHKEISFTSNRTPVNRTIPVNWP